MAKLIKNINSLVTMNSDGALQKSGSEMTQIGNILNAAMIFDDKIIWTGENSLVDNYIKKNNIQITETIDAVDKTVIPGFVDSHTHIVFAGDRSNEFARRLRGVTYKQIAEEGGGIQTTMKATRSATVDELTSNGYKLALNAIKHGTTSFEVKSGYGLNFESEMNQLKAIQNLKNLLPAHFSATFLGAHDFPPEYKSNRDFYIDLLINEMIPYVAENQLAEYCDAFIDEGYYTIEEGRKVLQAGLDNGLKLKVHADELVNTGAAKLAADLGAISADHLLFTSDESIEAMKKSGTVATLLPGTAYFIRMPYAPARKMLDAGLTVALSTDTNPGSSFTENMQLILSLAVINMNMTTEEALAAATINGAKAIEQSHRKGSLEIGKDSDFVILDTSSYAEMFYHFGINHVESTWIKGQKIK